jgi:ABC-2 type transport system permease protein
VIIIIGGWLFRVPFEVSSFTQLFAVFVLAMVALYGMGMMTSSLFLLLSREAWHLANLAQEPVYLASGFYFPIKSFQFWVAAAASFIPLTLGLDAMRQLSFATGPALGFLPVPVEILILAVLSAIFLTGAFLMLNHLEKLAIREGRLTESRR